MVTTARTRLERRIASVTYGYRYLSLEGALRRIAANGFEAVEIVGTRPHMLPEDFPGEDGIIASRMRRRFEAAARLRRSLGARPALRRSGHARLTPVAAE